MAALKPPNKPNRHSHYVAFLTITGLVVGIGLGVLARQPHHPILLAFTAAMTPLGVFALALPVATHVVWESAIKVIVWFILLEAGMCLAFIMLLYLLVWLVGRTNMRKFIRAVAPSQAVAVSTRSSLASLPAMLEGAEEELDLPEEFPGFVLPLCVSLFKCSQAVCSPIELLFLAHVYGVVLNPMTLLVFVATVLPISFSVPGIPSSGTHSSIPAYLATGVPLEGILLLNAVEPITDIFKTLLNVTADMAAVPMAARFTGMGSNADVTAPSLRR